VKLSDGVGIHVEQNQNTLCACRLSKGSISNILGTAESTKLNLSVLLQLLLRLLLLLWLLTTIELLTTAKFVTVTACDCNYMQHLPPFPYEVPMERKTIINK